MRTVALQRGGEGFDRHDLNTAVNVSEIAEDGHLGADVINHEGVLAELNFDAQFFFDEIHLAERAAILRPDLIVFKVIRRRVIATHADGLPT